MATLMHRGQAIPLELTTTTFELPGCNVLQSLGLVRGIVVRSRSIFGRIGADIQMLFGGNITLYTSRCETARENAFEIMLGHAQAVGANAVALLQLLPGCRIRSHSGRGIGLKPGTETRLRAGCHFPDRTSGTPPPGSNTPSRSPREGRLRRPRAR